jgi:transposase-like protein
MSRPEIRCHLENDQMDNVTPTPKKRTQRDYNLGFKLAIVDQVEKGEFTYKQAQKVYGIQGRSTVLRWLRKHGKLDWSVSRSTPMNRSHETPEQKIKRLERELEDERLRNLLLNEMIDIVDRDYGAGLRKKYLSKERASCKHKAK